MNSSISKQTDTQVTLEIKVGAEQLEHAKEHAFNSLRQHVKAAGFRPGKAPDDIVERELGSDAVQGEVLEHATTHSYFHAVAEHKLTPIAQPQVSLNKFVPYTELEYTATVEVMPKVELPDYKKLRHERPEIKVDPKEIDEAIDQLRKRLAERRDVKRPAQLEDAVTIDFDGSQKGEPVAGASAKSHELVLGSKTFIPGFEEELVGLKEGDQKDFKITFPADYHQESLAGQDVDFHIDVIKVKEVSLPKADDDFAAKVGPFKTMSELRADIEQRLKEEKAATANREFEQKVLDDVVSKAKLTIPARLADEQLQRLREELEQNLMYAGLDLPKYLEMRGLTEEKFTAELRPQAEKRVAAGLVLRQIAEAEGLEVSDDELDAELERLKQTYQDEKAQAELQQPQVRNDLANQLLLGKTVAKIVEYAEGK